MKVKLALALTAAALVGIAAQPGAARARAHLNACALLAGAAHHRSIAGHVSLSRPDPGSHAPSCSFSDEKTFLERKYSVSFGWVPNPSATAAHKEWRLGWDGAQRETGPLESVTLVPRIWGADESYLQELRGETPESTRSDVLSWRKGRNDGTVQLNATENSGVADYHEAVHLLRDILRLAPKLAH